jgi:hypothetical protein
MVTLSSTADSETFVVALDVTGVAIAADRFAASRELARLDVRSDSGLSPSSQTSARSEWSTTIASLAPENLELVKAIPIVIEEDDGTFVASFLDANINASGENSLDAYEQLKQTVVSRFRLLEKHEHELGTEPRRQLTVLRDFVRTK